MQARSMDDKPIKLPRTCGRNIPAAENDTIMLAMAAMMVA
jgi:hypothetical protein